MDGIAMAKQSSPYLLLLDMQLPDMSGFDVQNALRTDERTGAMPVVLGQVPKRQFAIGESS
jgi:CheY-like chemotaxis protein